MPKWVPKATTIGAQNVPRSDLWDLGAIFGEPKFRRFGGKKKVNRKSEIWRSSVKKLILWDWPGGVRGRSWGFGVCQFWSSDSARFGWGGGFNRWRAFSRAMVERKWSVSLWVLVVGCVLCVVCCGYGMAKWCLKSIKKQAKRIIVWTFIGAFQSRGVRGKRKEPKWEKNICLQRGVIFSKIGGLNGSMFTVVLWKRVINIL